MKFIKTSLPILTVVLLLASCADLSVQNTNNPSNANVIGSATDMKALAGGMYRSFYLGLYRYHDSPVDMYSVSADAMTCSWGNAAMRDQSWEPRKAWDNTPNYSYEFATSDYFTNMYGILSSARIILRAIDGTDIDFGTDTKMIEAWAKFHQGLALGYLGLSFDRAYVITEETTDEETAAPTLVDRTEMLAAGLAALDEAIAIADANSFSIPDGWINGVSVDNTLISDLANTYAARIIAYAPRNPAENTAAN